eukprot:CAMPEP_0175808194 /NCGR_PEP_ID=MMETSP0107_2-20121207/2127_1 /TAXON_ID=195067 ORGANISM="Goniomonas pacifica, Strain CCMP1869" /NCGR_SAMPLE_ID=MMETSP0107_2 /ASSEMBLY_ACC=CAM_ASM_000203 /LENGTH=426 /DNA_ID=CAMNT_0017119801 /DNA_START=62 /DNA_END=1338 /DNA_ORIENTATION=+
MQWEELGHALSCRRLQGNELTDLTRPGGPFHRCLSADYLEPPKSATHSAVVRGDGNAASKLVLDMCSFAKTQYDCITMRAVMGEDDIDNPIDFCFVAFPEDPHRVAGGRAKDLGLMCVLHTSLFPEQHSEQHKPSSGVYKLKAKINSLLCAADARAVGLAYEALDPSDRSTTVLVIHILRIDTPSVEIWRASVQDAQKVSGRRVQNFTKLKPPFDESYSVEAPVPSGWCAAAALAFFHDKLARMFPADGAISQSVVPLPSGLSSKCTPVARRLFYRWHSRLAVLAPELFRVAVRDTCLKIAADLKSQASMQQMALSMGVALTPEMQRKRAMAVGEDAALLWECLNAMMPRGGAEALPRAAAMASAMLEDTPLLLEHRDTDQWTLLHLTAFQGNYEAVKLLLTSRADLNAVEETSSHTALHLAALGA